MFGSLTSDQDTNLQWIYILILILKYVCDKVETYEMRLVNHHSRNASLWKVAMVLPTGLVPNKTINRSELNASNSCRHVNMIFTSYLIRAVIKHKHWQSINWFMRIVLLHKFIQNLHTITQSNICVEVNVKIINEQTIKWLNYQMFKCND